MKRVIFFLAFLLLFSLEVNAQEDTITFQKAFQLRMEVLEKHYAISFDSGWIPVINFEIPDSLPYSESYFEAAYNQLTQSFFINPRYENILFIAQDFERDTTVDEEFTELVIDPFTGELLANANYFRKIIDHELGHAFIDQFSRRNWYGSYPSTKQSQDEDGYLGLCIISEGFGMYFQMTSVRRMYYDWDIFPEELESFLWLSYSVLYDGGYVLVKEILDKNLEKGIFYLIKNPFNFDENCFRSDAIEYQKKALREIK